MWVPTVKSTRRHCTGGGGVWRCRRRRTRSSRSDHSLTDAGWGTSVGGRTQGLTRRTVLSTGPDPLPLDSTSGSTSVPSQAGTSGPTVVGWSGTKLDPIRIVDDWRPRRTSHGLWMTPSGAGSMSRPVVPHPPPVPWGPFGHRGVGRRPGVLHRGLHSRGYLTWCDRGRGVPRGGSISRSFPTTVHDWLTRQGCLFDM